MYKTLVLGYNKNLESDVIKMLGILYNGFKNYIWSGEYEIRIPWIRHKKIIDELDSLYVTARMLGGSIRFFRAPSQKNFFVEFYDVQLSDGSEPVSITVEPAVTLRFFRWSCISLLEVKVYGKRRRTTMNPFRFASFIESARLALIKKSDELS